jgi:hypothetical protein
MGDLEMEGPLEFLTCDICGRRIGAGEPSVTIEYQIDRMDVPGEVVVERSDMLLTACIGCAPFESQVSLALRTARSSVAGGGEVDQGTAMASKEEATLSLCRDIAVAAHAQQKDKAGQPYIGHPFRVAERSAHPMDKMVGLLHDVIEDTDFDAADLLSMGVPDAVVGAVEILTRVEPGYDDFVKRVHDSGNQLAIRVKRADIYDNLEPSRLEKLPDSTASYLREKYTRALAILNGQD